MRRKIRKWLSAHKFEAAVACIFGAIGFVVGLGVRSDLDLDLRLDNTIDPVALLSLGCTVVLVWVVASILDKEKEAEKSAKEILLKRAEELYSLVSQSATSARAGTLSYRQSAHLIKRLEMTINRLWRLLLSAGVTCDTAVKESLLTHMEALDVLLTDSPAQAASTKVVPLKVENDILQFSADHAVKVEAAFADLRDKLTELEFAIING